MQLVSITHQLPNAEQQRSSKFGGLNEYPVSLTASVNQEFGSDLDRQFLSGICYEAAIICQLEQQSYEEIIVARGYTSKVAYSHSFKVGLCVCLVARSYQIICDPMECNPPGPSVHGILQARLLEQNSISCSRGSS